MMFKISRLRLSLFFILAVLLLSYILKPVSQSKADEVLVEWPKKFFEGISLGFTIDDQGTSLELTGSTMERSGSKVFNTSIRFAVTGRRVLTNAILTCLKKGHVLSRIIAERATILGDKAVLLMEGNVQIENASGSIRLESYRVHISLKDFKITCKAPFLFKSTKFSNYIKKGTFSSLITMPKDTQWLKRDD